MPSLMHRFLIRLGLARPPAPAPEAPVPVLVPAPAPGWDEAGDPHTPPEKLYDLASHGETEVRARVAANRAAPWRADLLLAEDAEGDVRCELARKIARLAPDLSGHEAGRLHGHVMGLIEKLSADTMPQVRQAVAEAVAHSANVPPELIQRLARDAEAAVAAPILEFSPLLSDDDLLEIIAAARVSGILEPIARRRAVSEEVADAVTASLEIPAIAALLNNPKAQIREETMERIACEAQGQAALQEPLALRADLSVRVMQRIAGFANAKLIAILEQRRGLDEATAETIRIRSEELLKQAPSIKETRKKRSGAVARVRAAAKRGTLDADFLADLLDKGEREAVILALSCMAGIRPCAVERVLDLKNPKAVTALCWQARLPMRAAMEIQTKIARIPHGQVLLARNGVEYPLSEQELLWHVDYLRTVA